MLLRPFTLHAPTTIVEAAKLQATLEDARILAGGTFLLNSLKLMKRKGSKTPAHVISLRKIKELKNIRVENNTLLIGAMTIVNDLYDSPLLTHNTAILRSVCKNISTNPIRNMATVGGNLTCRYTWTEFGSVMVALEANMHFIDQDGQEEIVSAENFFTNAAKSDKIFSHVSIKIDNSASVAYQRVKKSANVDIPLLAVCVKTNLVEKKFTNTRVTVNSGSAFAQRDQKLENFLDTQTAHPGLEIEALDHLESEIYDKRSDDYKKHIFRISLKNAIKEIYDQTHHQ
jgi:CO/xanthine dehydrogenase FAD-binding subunit